MSVDQDLHVIEDEPKFRAAWGPDEQVQLASRLPDPMEWAALLRTHVVDARVEVLSTRIVVYRGDEFFFLLEPVSDGMIRVEGDPETLAPLLDELAENIGAFALSIDDEGRVFPRRLRDEKSVTP